MSMIGVIACGQMCTWRRSRKPKCCWRDCRRKARTSSSSATAASLSCKPAVLERALYIIQHLRLSQIKPFIPVHVFRCGFTTTEFFAKFWGTRRILILMISDVVDDIKACLQIALFLLCFGVLKVKKLKKIAKFLMCVRFPCQEGCMVLHYR